MKRVNNLLLKKLIKLGEKNEISVIQAGSSNIFIACAFTEKA